MCKRNGGSDDDNQRHKIARVHACANGDAVLLVAQSRRGGDSVGMSAAIAHLCAHCIAAAKWYMKI